MADPIYVLSDGALVPTERARGPWSPKAQHGGPPTGLLARAALQAVPAEHLRLARLTVDFVRVVPMSPITTRVEVVRNGRRAALLRAELLCGTDVVALAHAAFLAEGSDAPRAYAAALPGPDGFADGKIMPEAAFQAFGYGFHSTVDVRWVGHDDPCAAWFRMPGPLVESEPNDPSVCAAALSDFVNAMTSFGRLTSDVAFINTDTTVYFGRGPEGEWIGLSATGAGDAAGVGFGEVLLFDERGCFGRAVQSRLANSAAWRG